MEKYKKWVGFDLDGVLANSSRIGGEAPIGKLIRFSKFLFLKEYNKGKKYGYEIRIFTARACEKEEVKVVKQWLKDNDFPEVEVTNKKDKGLIRLYDDRAVAIKRNTADIMYYPEFTRREGK